MRCRLAHLVRFVADTLLLDDRSYTYDVDVEETLEFHFPGGALLRQELQPVQVLLRQANDVLLFDELRPTCE